MTERYFKKMYEEKYYIFDSETISESEFDERFEYSGYRAFEDSMQGDEVIDQLNKQDDLIRFLRKDNLTVYAVLGDVRALIRSGNVEEAIERINTIEREIKEWLKKRLIKLT